MSIVESTGSVRCNEHGCSDLPAGWEKEEQLVGAGKFGEVWVGLRRDVNGFEVRRILRLLPIGEQASLRERLVSRCTKLSNLAIPHVSLPDEVWQTNAGCLALACPHHGNPLEALLTKDRGLGTSLESHEQWLKWAASHCGYDAGDSHTERLLEQLLTGLAGLHDHGVAHGDLRPRNVYLDGGESARATAWLADAAIGPLARWSEGHMRDPDSSHYHPPEWSGTTQDANFQADHFALGLTYCETVLGTDADPRRGEHNRNFTAADQKQLLAELGEHGISGRARRVVKKLLEPSRQARPSTAVEVLEFWRRQNSPSRWSLLPCALAAGLLLLLILTWRGWAANSRQVADLTKTVQTQDAAVTELAADRDRFKSQLDQMTNFSATLDRIAQKIDLAHPEVNRTPPNSALTLWQKAYGKVRLKNGSAIGSTATLAGESRLPGRWPRWCLVFPYWRG